MLATPLVDISDRKVERFGAGYVFERQDRSEI
jgi:hypothetical protein